MEEGELTACLTAELGHWSSPALTLGLTSLVLLVLRPSDLAKTTGLPGSPACRQQIMGLGFHSHLSQFLIINQSLFLSDVLQISLNISCWFCSSEEP